MERTPDLWPALVRCYLQLARLPRKLRRQLQRRWRRSLAALALLLALGQAPALAANFDIPCPGGVGDNAALIQAINDANDEVANLGPDSITLVANCTHTLTEADNNTFGATGLPVVSSPITIEGNGSTIERESADPDQFRIFAINGSGDLTLNETTVSGGATAGGSFPECCGSGVFNYGGALTLTHSTVSGNSANVRGGGVYNASFYGSTLTLTNSTVSGNSAGSVGGGVFNRGFYRSTLTLTNSTVSGNSARYYGGGVYNGSGDALTLTHSTVSGNSANVRGGGVYNYGPATLSRSLVSGNTAPRGAEVHDYFRLAADDFNLLAHRGEFFVKPKLSAG